jgi:hypothetical protein
VGVCGDVIDESTRRGSIVTAFVDLSTPVCCSRFFMNEEGLETDKTHPETMTRPINNVLWRNFVLALDLGIRLDTISRRSFSKMQTLQIRSKSTFSK